MQGLLDDKFNERKKNISRGFQDDAPQAKPSAEQIMFKAFFEQFAKEVKKNARLFEDDDLEKGEGARGGKVIGHTKSGKPIYESKRDYGSYSHFSVQDHKDAAEAHTQLAKKHAVKAMSAIKDEKTGAVGHGAISQKHQAAARMHREAVHADNNGRFFDHYDKDSEKFFDVVSKYYEPTDDGESEYMMLRNLSKHKKADKMLDELDGKSKQTT